MTDKAANSLFSPEVGVQNTELILRMGRKDACRGPARGRHVQAETTGLPYLQGTTQFNRVCIIHHRNSKIWSLQKFFEEKAILHYLAAY